MVALEHFSKLLVYLPGVSGICGLQLSAYSDGGRKLIFAAHDYHEEVKTVVAEAYAAAIAGAATHHEGHDCFAWVLSNICWDTIADPDNCVECVAMSYSESWTEEFDAIADAGTFPPPYIAIHICCIPVMPTLRRQGAYPREAAVRPKFSIISVCI